MSITLACPKCKRKYNFKDNTYAGKVATCLTCHAKFKIPAIEEYEECEDITNNEFLGHIHYYVCPSCGVKKGVRDKSLGTIAKCGGCKHKLELPDIITQAEWDEWCKSLICLHCDNPIKEKLFCCKKSPDIWSFIKQHRKAAISLASISAIACLMMLLFIPSHISIVTTVCYCFSAVVGVTFMVYKLITGEQ